MTTALSHEPSRVDAPISDFDPYAEDALDNPYPHYEVDPGQGAGCARRHRRTNAFFAKRGARVVGSTPQQMDRFVREETARWAQVIKAAKITVD